MKFIIFNYDRSFECLLARGLSNFYGLDNSRAEKLVSLAEIYHPYGKIGKLPFQAENSPSLRYGSGEKRNLFEISQSILTFSEQIEDGKQLESIRAAVEWANQLVFLGFSFNETNMDLLRPENRSSDTRRVIATGIGISEPDCEVIKRSFKDLCMTESTAKFQKTGQYILDNSVTCSQVFEKYRKTLMS